MERQILDLLIVLRDSIKDKEQLYLGLCHEVRLLCNNRYINTDEAIKLYIYIHCNKPIYNPIPVFGWEKYLVKPRVDWLNEQIKLLQDDKNT